jgi:hypothetical protein
VQLGRGRHHVTASSTLTPDALGKRYDAALAKDGDTRTAWSEGVAGAGVGESLELSFDSPRLPNQRRARQRLREEPAPLPPQRPDLTGPRRHRPGKPPQRAAGERTDFQAAGLRAGGTDFVRIVIDGVFGGERCEDTLISEVRFRVVPRR